ncbi:MAG: hypothetical protein ACR2FZ_07135 [Thermoleophilaceae bacterium]
MTPEERAVGAYAVQGHDRMREALETGFFARLLPGLLAAASIVALEALGLHSLEWSGLGIQTPVHHA